MRSILGLFAKSPFGPLSQHTEKVHETVVQLRPLVELFVEGKFDESLAVTKRIFKLEHQADLIKDEIRAHLPSSLLLPVDRGDLLLFLREQDRIADRVEDVGDLLAMRPTPTPEALRPHVLDLVDQVIRTSETWYAASTELTLLKEASFGGAEAAKVEKMVEEVSFQEWEADKKEAALLKTLFTFEQELGPVSVIVWMEIVQMLGRVADYAENTADLLRLMLARS